MTASNIRCNNLHSRDAVLISVYPPNDTRVVGIGATLQLIPIFSDGGSYQCIWTSHNQTIATINQSGLVTGIALGQVNISCSYKNVTITFSTDIIIPATLLRLDEAEVSMLCIDGSDGKGNAFQLHPIFDDAQSHLCQWSSSDATKATVSSTGVVTGVSAGNVMISCTHLGVNKSCKFTIYRTLPDEMTLAQLPGGNAYVNFFALTDERPSARFAFVKKNPTIPYPFGMWISVAGSWTIYSAGNFENSPMRLRYVTTTEYQDYATTAPPQQHRVNAYEIIGVENPLMNAQFTVDGIPVELGKSYYTTASGSYHAPDLMPYILDDGNYPAIKPISVSSDHSRLAQFVDLRDRTKVSQMAVYQNYIRYADHDGIVNRTVLPNMGYGGSQYNLESNGTVPNEWFGDSI